MQPRICDCCAVQDSVSYARSDGLHIAYQVVGDGPVDLAVVQPWVVSFEHSWDVPPIAAFFERLTRFSRLILFDKRGTGLSDQPPAGGQPTLEERMDDLRAVLDAAGSRRCALFGQYTTAWMMALFAATYPRRTLALVIHNGTAAGLRRDDYPWGRTPESYAEEERIIESGWGNDGHVRWDMATMAPAALADPELVRLTARMIRRSASPGAAIEQLRLYRETDIRDILPSIAVPTLITRRGGDSAEARYLAERIPGAVLEELPGADVLPFLGDVDAVPAAVQRFLAEITPEADLDRAITTVMFTDIVQSTDTAAELGDRAWATMLNRHNGIVRAQLARFRGQEIDTAGDGFLATFDGPARAIRCAGAITEEVGSLGIDVRIGLHTGECQIEGDQVRGLAVHIGARIAGIAQPGQVLVSSTVKDLVAGSGIRFEEAGEHELKGIPDRWRLFQAG
jgi:class 3 adenylate cyclase